MASATASSNFVGLYGKDLFRLCTSQERGLISACEGYILGVQDSIQSRGLEMPISLCFPSGVTVTAMRAELVKFMDSRRHLHEEPATQFVARMFAKEFSCKWE